MLAAPSALVRYSLLSYILIWAIATPLILLAAQVYEVPFAVNYQELVGSIPLPLSITIVCFSAVPSYYIPASLYFRRVRSMLTVRLILISALVFWGLAMLLDIVFVIIISNINILTYPFNWIYLSVSPVMVASVCLAGARILRYNKNRV